MKNNQELVSVIIPVYNSEKYIKRCIKSVVKQTYKKIEIIVIDDGSTDTTPMILDKLSSEYEKIKVIHKKNEGVSVARNDGLDNAAGKYIYFVDSDDYIAKDAVEKLVFTKENTESDLVVCGFDYILNDNSHNNIVYFQKMWKKDVKQYIEVFSEKIYSLYYGALWNKLYDSKIIMKYNIRFAQDISYAEDFLFNVQYLKHIQFVSHIPQVLYNYDATEECSLSRKNRDGTLLWNMSKMRINHFINLCRDLKVEELCVNRAYKLMAYELMNPLHDIISSKKSLKDKAMEYKLLLLDSDAETALSKTSKLNWTLKQAKKAMNNKHFELLAIKYEIIKLIK